MKAVYSSLAESLLSACFYKIEIISSANNEFLSRLCQTFRSVLIREKEEIEAATSRC